MPKFVIERELPGAGSLTPAQLQGISRTFCSALRSLGPRIPWLQSYVADDKIYCIYIAPSADLIREHAANTVSEVMAIIGPPGAGRDGARSSPGRKPVRAFLLPIAVAAG